MWSGLGQNHHLRCGNAWFTNTRQLGWHPTWENNDRFIVWWDQSQIGHSTPLETLHGQGDPFHTTVPICLLHIEFFKI